MDYKHKKYTHIKCHDDVTYATFHCELSLRASRSYDGEFKEFPVNTETKHKHRYTELAPAGGLQGEPGDIWAWCIYCGKLKLGRQTFTPGPHQKPSFLSDQQEKRRKCGYCFRLLPESQMEFGDSVIPGRWHCIDAEACNEAGRKVT